MSLRETRRFDGTAPADRQQETNGPSIARCQIPRMKRDEVQGHQAHCSCLAYQARTATTVGLVGISLTTFVCNTNSTFFVRPSGRR